MSEIKPEHPQIKKIEIALQIDTGNTIYKSFSDAEQAMEFIKTYFQNPQEILKKITPKQSIQLPADFEDIDPINPSGDSPL